MRRQHGLVPGEYFFFPNLLEVEDGDVVSHSISVLTCSDATCQPAGVYGLTSRTFLVFILLLLRLFPHYACKSSIAVIYKYKSRSDGFVWDWNGHNVVH